jgi:hypothetical protein
MRGAAGIVIVSLLLVKGGLLKELNSGGWGILSSST